MSDLIWTVTKDIGKDLWNSELVSKDFDYKDKEKAYDLLKEWKKDEETLECWICLH